MKMILKIMFWLPATLLACYLLAMICLIIGNLCSYTLDYLKLIKALK